MDLESGRPFWPLRNGLIESYPRLRTSIEADVVVVGAGITGALVADALARAGQKVVVIDRRDVAGGSTSASTALLQYEIDTSLVELSKWYGRAVASALYRSGIESLKLIEAICCEIPESGGFQTRPSLYFASSEQDVHDLEAEYRARREEGLPVEFLDAAAIGNHWDFHAPAAIYSSSAGEVDPYRLTHGLLKRVVAFGGDIFDRTVIRQWSADRHGVRIETEYAEIHAKWGVIAAGYESATFLPSPVAKLINTYAFVSEPVLSFAGWADRCLIWETARPYLYLRTTLDGRVLAGGNDSPSADPDERDRLLPGKVKELASRVRSMFPRIDFDVDYAWGGTFAETGDGLPYIGEHPERPGLLFALCYGGNGITYAALAASILRDHILGREHPLASAVGFNRQSRAMSA